MAVGPASPYRVAVLGATGLVGQRLVERLDGHPWFRLTVVAASERSTGRSYGEAVRWRLPGDPPQGVAGLPVARCLPDDARDCDLVFSALDASVARDVEREFSDAGLPVVTNSSAHRQDPDVPILVPEINAAHLPLVRVQRERTGGGYIVTNPNCSAAGLVLALAPLHRSFGLRRVVVATLQALSGAGLDGPSGLDVVDNVIPWIPGEEDKVEREIRKMLGRLGERSIVPADVAVSAHCHRVPTLDGHLAAVSVELERAAEPEAAAAALRGFESDIQDLGLPSAPQAPLELRPEDDRPQPRLDRDAGGGMAAVVGRLRPCPALTLRFELLAHNTIRGAAGAAILNAELLVARDLVSRRDPR